ncbi:hypothetical protein GZH44_07550 [Weissella hellenica]|nr:hypothetical protein GZH44_07550 [Weissella hellenica]
MNDNDFMEQLATYLNVHLNLPLPVQLSFLTDDPSIALFPVPGGQATTSYWDTTKEMDFKWELMVQEASAEDTAAIMWAIYGALAKDDLMIMSSNGSYKFKQMNLNQPELEGEKNEMTVWSLSGSANLTI